MKKKILICIILFGVLQLIKVLLIQQAASEYCEKRLTCSLRKDSQFTYQSVAFNDIYLEKHPVLINELQDGESDTEKMLTIVGTNEFYDQLEHLRFVDGAFFTAEAVQQNKNVVVISDQLSTALFQSDKGAHNVIHLGGEAYEIVGVYKSYRSFNDYVISDGYERVYVPLTSSAVTACPIKQVIFNGDYLEAMPSKEELSQMGLIGIGGIQRDQSDWVKCIKGRSQLPMLFMTLSVIAIGSWGLYRKAGYGLVLLRKEVDQRRKYVLIGKMLAKLGGYLIGMIVLVKIGFTNVYVRSDALPPENIFDLTFYWKMLRGEWQVHNQLLLTPARRFEQVIYLLKEQIKMINVVQLTLLFLMGLNLKVNKKIAHKK